MIIDYQKFRVPPFMSIWHMLDKGRWQRRRATSTFRETQLNLFHSCVKLLYY